MERIPFPKIWLFLLPFCLAVILGSCGTNASATPAPTQQGEPRPSSSRTCQTKQLYLVEERGGAAAGHLGARFSFTNHSKATCTLQGYPSLQQLDVQHKSLNEPIIQTTWAYVYHTPSPLLVSLHVGEKAYFVIEWTDVCSAISASFLLITPPGNQSAILIDIRHPAPLSTVRTLAESQVLLPISLHIAACQDTVHISPLVPNCQALGGFRCD